MALYFSATSGISFSLRASVVSLTQMLHSGKAMLASDICRSANWKSFIRNYRKIAHPVKGESVRSDRLRIFPIFVFYKFADVLHTWGESFGFAMPLSAFFRQSRGKACMGASDFRLMGCSILGDARTRREIQTHKSYWLQIGYSIFPRKPKYQTSPSLVLQNDIAISRC